jgi:hypothetical protein
LRMPQVDTILLTPISVTLEHSKANPYRTGTCSKISEGVLLDSAYLAFNKSKLRALSPYTNEEKDNANKTTANLHKLTGTITSIF